MYKLCKTEQSAARQRELEKWLLEAMLTRHYDEITVSDLCQAGGIPRKSFYRYFSGKDGALHALLDHTMMEYEGYSKAKERSRSLLWDLENFFLFWQEQKRLLDALQRSGLSGVLIERSISHALSEAVLPNRFVHQEDTEMRKQVVTFCMCGLMSMILTWHHEGYCVSPEQMAVTARRLVGQPLLPDADVLY